MQVLLLQKHFWKNFVMSHTNAILNKVDRTKVQVPATYNTYKST